MPAEFQLDDAEGNPHSYYVTLHPFDSGSRISYELVRAGGPALPRLLAMVLADGGVLEKLQDSLGAAGGEASLDDLGGIVGDIAKSIDLRAVGADLESVLHSLDGADLAKRVLSRAVRDGKPLSEPENLTAAYAGNYAEMWTAVLKIAQANRFFPVPTGSRKAKA